MFLKKHVMMVGRFLMLSAVITTAACNNEDVKTTPPPPKDSIADQGTPGGTPMKENESGNTPTGIEKTTATAAPAPSAPAEATAKPSQTEKATVKAENPPIKENSLATGTGKEKLTTKSSTTEAPAVKDSKLAKSEEAKANSKSTAPPPFDPKKPFVSKFGVIPWDANENNITEFLNAFPDKRTLIRINYNTDPDADMQSVKAQIIKTLKKVKYLNVSDQSDVVRPLRMAKKIHFELQRDGSVTIWLPTVVKE